MLSDKQKITFFKRIKLFKDGTDDDLKMVASITNEVHFHDDEDIFLEGDSGDAVYLVVHGQVKIHTMGKQIAIRMDNEFFGEMAIIDDRLRSATATSMGDSVLLKIDRDNFFSVMQSNSGFLRNLLKALVSRLREDINLTVEAAVEATRIKQDLLRAHELQVNILPSGDLNHISSNGATITVSGVCLPAESIGGDYYDYFRLSDHQVGIVIGDVMGHGFHSGLMVFTTKSCLHTRIISSYDISDMMSVLNKMVYRFVKSDMFMTFCYLVVDMADYTISFCNAGHDYPYHYRRDLSHLDCLESDTIPLGIKEKLSCAVKTVTWNEGDILVLYTDGIIDAQNSHGEKFGNERLESLIVGNAKLSALELKNLIINELNRHCQNNAYKDDVTLVIAKMGKGDRIKHD
ncbi:MAG: Cyclic nucleotide-binding protein [Candidatus Poribacteria bacterium]|nr:Cyclic nucleotide-binding protein [Candidatus Poribacteria bacterium]